MSKFKAGDRVKKARHNWAIVEPPEEVIPLDLEGEVIGYGYDANGGFGCYVVFDKYPSTHPTKSYTMSDWQLEPLTRPGLSAEDEKFVKDLQDALFSQLPDFNPKPRQGEIVQAGDV